jgi:hypothetical protein
MADFNIRSDQVNVEQIMDQIRARIREKRGVDYTEQQIRELASVKLEKILDPRGVRSELLEEFRRMQAATPAPPNFTFGEETLFETHRAPLRFLRRLLKPVLKLFFNPNPLIQALHIQSQLNDLNARRRAVDHLHFEVLHNLVVEITRMSIEVKTLRMRVESLTGRLEFSERRSRALESVVAYRPSPEERGDVPPVPARTRTPEAAPQREPPSPAAPPPAGEGPGQRSRRRRRRRGRRGGAPPATAIMGAPGAQDAAAEPVDGEPGPPAVSSIEDAMVSETHRSEPLSPAADSAGAAPSADHGAASAGQEPPTGSHHQ